METNPSKYKILVVDDVDANVLLLKTILKKEGFCTDTAYSGQECLSKVRDNHYDLILLDVMMPGMNGYEVLAFLKNDPDTQNIPIIMLTALTDSSAIDKAKQIGAIDFITKPFKRTEMLIQIGQVLEK